MSLQYILYQSTASFGRISNSIEISLVGRVPDSGFSTNKVNLTLYMLIFQKEHKHVSTFYVIPPH